MTRLASRPKAPEQGDVVWLDHDPPAGHEQAGRRPTLVVSPKTYNAASGLMLCCPVTSQVKGYPFEVALVGVKGLTGVVLSDQMRSLDWKARTSAKAGRATDAVVVDVLAKVSVLLTKIP